MQIGALLVQVLKVVGSAAVVSAVLGATIRLISKSRNSHPPQADSRFERLTSKPEEPHRQVASMQGTN
jgi:hypothetical protein